MKVFKDYAQIQNYTFSTAERTLIGDFNVSYHTFAQLPLWKMDEMLRNL